VTGRSAPVGLLVRTEHHGGRRNKDQRAADEPKQCHAPWHEARPVHQVAEQEPVADADTEAGPEQKRPVMDRHQRPSYRVESSRLSRQVLPQRHYRKEAGDPDGDNGALNDPSGHVSKGEAFVLPPEDREQREGRADIRDDADSRG
jgi:hypothetical protein